MRRNMGLFVIYILIGLYVFNLGLVLFKIPESLIFLNKWVLMVGGGLIVFASFRFLRYTSLDYR